jgi:hypothetical protein
LSTSFHTVCSERAGFAAAAAAGAGAGAAAATVFAGAPVATFSAGLFAEPFASAWCFLALHADSSNRRHAHRICRL